jgi:hypothetical protein
MTTQRTTGDSFELGTLVSGMHRLAGDQQDARRVAHNPAIYRARFVPERAGSSGLQRSLADSATNRQAASEQVSMLPKTTS